MKKKKVLVWLLSSVFLVGCIPGAGYAKHPAKTIMNFYGNEIEDWDTVVPYTVGILALNELAHKRHSTEVRKFILWYFSKLNYPDKHGLTGTIYDYALQNDKEHATNDYDSVDGYSGLFLHLLHRYVVATGDTGLLKDNWKKIEDIAYTIPYLQEEDGLTRALPDSQVKYLMDNCEAYGGIAAYLELRKLAGKGNSNYYSQVKMAIRQGIFQQLYEPEYKIFAWAIENGEQSTSSREVYYPDMYAQLFLIYYDLLDNKPDVRADIWRTFYEKYGGKAADFPIEQRIIYELTKAKIENEN